MCIRDSFLEDVLLWPLPFYDNFMNVGNTLYRFEIVSLGVVSGSVAFRAFQFNDATGILGMYLVMGACLAIGGPIVAKMNGVTYNPTPHKKGGKQSDTAQ